MSSTRGVGREVDTLADTAKLNLSRLASMEEKSRAALRKCWAAELGAFSGDLGRSNVPESAVPWLLAEYFKLLVDDSRSP